MDRHLETSGARVTHDLIRYVQVGRAEGHLRIGGHDLAVTPATWWGERDHSWGVRPLPRVEGSPPTARLEWSFLLFLPLQFEDFGFHLYLFEDRDGHPTHRSCGLMEAGGAGREHVARLAHDLVWETDAPTPTLVSGSLDVELRSGRRLAIDLTALQGRAHLRGGGYGGVDGWFQGQWRDGETLTHEVWDLSDRNRLRSWGAYSSDHLPAGHVRRAGRLRDLGVHGPPEPRPLRSGTWVTTRPSRAGSRRCWAARSARTTCA